MNYINFSKSYHVRMLTERDIPLVLDVYKRQGQRFSPFLCRIFRPHPWARWKMPFRLNWMPAAADRKQRRGTFPDEEQGTEPLCRFAPEAKPHPARDHSGLSLIHI